MMHSLCLICLLTLGQDPAPAAEPFIISSVEEKFAADVSKAESDLAKVWKSAGEVRLKAYKDKLADVTKSGDFDKAVGIKARVTQLEQDPESGPVKQPKRSRPKDTVKFKGHTYALVRDPATWHMAKQRCEEMGGRLACINNPAEQEFVSRLCGATSAWVGASDEAEEGKWINVDGSAAVFSGAIVDNANSLEHWMMWNGERFNDFHAGARNCFVCEWDK